MGEALSQRFNGTVSMDALPFSSAYYGVMLNIPSLGLGINAGRKKKKNPTTTYKFSKPLQEWLVQVKRIIYYRCGVSLIGRHDHDFRPHYGIQSK